MLDSSSCLVLCESPFLHDKNDFIYHMRIILDEKVHFLTQNISCELLCQPASHGKNFGVSLVVIRVTAFMMTSSTELFRFLPVWTGRRNVLNVIVFSTMSKVCIVDT